MSVRVRAGLGMVAGVSGLAVVLGFLPGVEVSAAAPRSSSGSSPVVPVGSRVRPVTVSGLKAPAVPGAGASSRSVGVSRAVFPVAGSVKIGLSPVLVSAGSSVLRVAVPVVSRVQVLHLVSGGRALVDGAGVDPDAPSAVTVTTVDRAEMGDVQAPPVSFQVARAEVVWSRAR